MSAIVSAVLLFAGLTCTLALGTQTTIEKYPSIVQVEDRVGAVWLQQCVGSVLTSYHILSAASCFSDVQYSTRNRRIRAGTSTRGVDGIVKEVYAVYNHPTYGELGNDGDITVVRLISALTLGDTIQQAPILGNGIELPDGLHVTIAGWGTTAEGGIIGNNYLYSLSLYVENNESCMLKYYPEFKIVTENMICVGLTESEGRDFDSRDVGAPIFYDGTTVGVASFGVSRGNDELPIVATAVASYTTWITETAKV